jgi:hypothetical protein
MKERLVTVEIESPDSYPDDVIKQALTHALSASIRHRVIPGTLHVSDPPKVYRYSKERNADIYIDGEVVIGVREFGESIEVMWLAMGYRPVSEARAFALALLKACDVADEMK